MEPESATDPPRADTERTHTHTTSEGSEIEGLFEPGWVLWKPRAQRTFFFFRIEDEDGFATPPIEGGLVRADNPKAMLLKSYRQITENEARMPQPRFVKAVMRLQGLQGKAIARLEYSECCSLEAH